MKLRSFLQSLAIPLIAILLGLLASSIFVVIAGANPIDAYQSLFCEGFGPQTCTTFGDLIITQVPNESGGTETVFSPLYGSGGNRLAVVLEQATPVILTALAAVVVFQAGMFSIGMDGQFVLGAVTAAFLGYALPDLIYRLTGVSDPKAAPEGLMIIMHLVVPAVIITLSMLVGAIYAWIPGYLRVKLNVNELISSIIFNGIAVQIVNYMINYPLRADPNSNPSTRRIDDTAWLVPFNRALFQDIDWFSGARLGVGVLIVLIAAALVWFYLKRTTAGYEQRMTRGSGLFARFGGIPSARAALRAMVISGALSGLAGAITILGVERRLVLGFAEGGTGFEGVLVAILANESVLGILLFAPFFAGLNLGAANMQFGNLPRQLGGIIISFIILFSSMEEFLRQQFTNIGRSRFFRRPDKPAEVGGEAVT